MYGDASELSDKRAMKPMVCATNPESEAVARPAARAATLNCLTVDVEEYFHAEVFHNCLSPADWPRMERRAGPFVERIANLLETHHSRATFFVLGVTVSYLAPLLRQIAAGGHEIACHGNGHQHLARLTPQQLRDDLRAARCRIEDAVGVRPRGYRAPTFSITPSTAWALDVIIAEGFEYDASVFPIRHDRYGVPNAPREPFWAVAPSGARILEFPPLTLGRRPLRVPVGGGGYLRLLPASVVDRCIAARERRSRPAMIYVHPWELDLDQPRLPVGRLSEWRHRVNLHRTESKLVHLLRQHRFDTAQNVLGRVRVIGKVPSFRPAHQRAAGIS